MLESVIEQVERGIRGEHRHLKMYDDPERNKLSRMAGQVAFGAGRYLLCAGPPGTGKTAWVDTQLVLKPILGYMKYGGVEPNYIYRAMERSAVDKIAKLYCAVLFMQTGEMLDPATLLSYGNASRKLNDRDIARLVSYQDFFKDISKYLDIVPGASTASKVLDYATRQAKKRGTYIEAFDSVVINGEPYAYEGAEMKGGVLKAYRDTQFGRIYEESYNFFPQDNKAYIHITDHVGKIKPGGKDAIDTHSNNMADVLRDVYNYGVVDILQMNRGIDDTYRQKNEVVRIKQSDIKGSNVPVENADVIVGLLDPQAFKLKKYDDYVVEDFTGPYNKSRLRVLFVVKNSNGSAFNMGLAFWGEHGVSYELPQDVEPYIIDSIHDYSFRP